MKYRVKVTEKHSDIVVVGAESEEEARDKAMEVCDCSFELTYDSQVLGTEE